MKYNSVNIYWYYNNYYYNILIIIKLKLIEIHKKLLFFLYPNGYRFKFITFHYLHYKIIKTNLLYIIAKQNIWIIIYKLYIHMTSTVNDNYLLIN